MKETDMNEINCPGVRAVCRTELVLLEVKLAPHKQLLMYVNDAVELRSNIAGDRERQRRFRTQAVAAIDDGLKVDW